MFYEPGWRLPAAKKDTLSTSEVCDERSQNLHNDLP